MTREDALKFLLEHNDDSRFEMKNEYGYWCVVTLSQVSYMSLKQLVTYEMRDIEEK